MLLTMPLIYCKGSRNTRDLIINNKDLIIENFKKELYIKELELQLAKK